MSEKVYDSDMPYFLVNDIKKALSVLVIESVSCLKRLGEFLAENDFMAPFGTIESPLKLSWLLIDCICILLLSNYFINSFFLL